MTYDAAERSLASGRPVELYSFNRQSQYFRYTSADSEQVVSSNTYQSVVIKRANIEQGTELNRGALQISVQRDLALVALYQAGPPSEIVTCQISQFHAGDNQVQIIWSGRIISMSIWADGMAKIILEPVYNSLRRMGLRRVYQRQCPHLLYGAACGANSSTFRVPGVTASSGTTLTVSAVGAFANGYFAGGYVEWQVIVGIYERRFIESHTTTSLVLSTRADVALGTAVNVYPGCDHLLATCNSKFANAANFGGLPYIPSKNPFDGTPVY